MADIPEYRIEFTCGHKALLVDLAGSDWWGARYCEVCAADRHVVACDDLWNRDR